MPFTRPALLIRIEEFALLVAALFLYHQFHFSWLLFAILFFAPDLSMLAFLANARVGAASYNLAHTVFMPLLLIAIALTFHHPSTVAIGFIWLAHIFFDRLLGYGLKYPTNFKDTHLHHIP